MKKILLLFIVIFITSCYLDKVFEKEGEIDVDDINIIDKIGDQSLDKAIKMFYDTNSSAS